MNTRAVLIITRGLVVPRNRFNGNRYTLRLLRANSGQNMRALFQLPRHIQWTCHKLTSQAARDTAGCGSRDRGGMQRLPALPSATQPLPILLGGELFGTSPPCFGQTGCQERHSPKRRMQYILIHNAQLFSRQRLKAPLRLSHQTMRRLEK